MITKIKIKPDMICSAGMKFYYEIHNQPTFLSEDPDPVQVDLCRQFIRERMRIDKKGHSSYHFKHSVEKHFNVYITNGAFILAALLEDSRMFSRSISPNVTVLLEEKKDND